MLHLDLDLMEQSLHTLLLKARPRGGRGRKGGGKGERGGSSSNSSGRKINAMSNVNVNKCSTPSTWGFSPCTTTVLFWDEVF